MADEIKKAEPVQTTAPWNMPQTWDDIGRMAGAMSRSDLVPELYRGKPNNILVALDYGQRLGIPGLMALQNIGVINGRPMLYGDAPLALARQHDDFIDIDEEVDDSDESNLIAQCTLTIKRRDGKHKDVVRRFTWADAKRAGLNGKSIWQKYPRRMLQMRARGLAIRDGLPDCLMGARTEDEMDDLRAEEVKPVDATVVEPPPAPTEVEIVETSEIAAPGDCEDEVVNGATPPKTAKPPGAAKQREPKHHENPNRKPGRGMVEGDTWANIVGERFEYIDGRWSALSPMMDPEPPDEPEQPTPETTEAQQAKFATEQKAKALGITVVEPTPPMTDPLFRLSVSSPPEPVKGGLWWRTKDDKWFDCPDGQTWIPSGSQPEENYEAACLRLSDAMQANPEESLEVLWEQYETETSPV